MHRDLSADASMVDVVCRVDMPATQQLDNVQGDTYLIQFAEKSGPINTVKCPFKIYENLDTPKNRKSRVLIGTAVRRGPLHQHQVPDFPAVGCNFVQGVLSRAVC